MTSGAREAKKQGKTRGNVQREIRTAVGWNTVTFIAGKSGGSLDYNPISISISSKIRSLYL